MTATEAKKTIPVPSLKRLNIYHSLLNQLENEQEYISATQIADNLNLIPIQVRKDIAFTGIIGKPKLGYNVKKLIATIETFLGWNNTKNAFLVGAGDLGKAILKYPGFKKLGLEIIAAFDADQEKIGTSIGEIQVLPIEKIKELAIRMKVKVGIITVPTETAQGIADILIEAGIIAIWNFAPVKLKLPSHLIVQNENLASSLAVLCKQLNTRLTHKN